MGMTGESQGGVCTVAAFSLPPQVKLPLKFLGMSWFFFNDF